MTSTSFQHTSEAEGFLVLAAWLFLGARLTAEPASMLLEVEPPRAPDNLVEIRCPAAPGTYCRLYASADLTHWEVRGTAAASEEGVSFGFPASGTGCEFYQLELVGLQPLEQMVWITPGEFMISSPTNEVGRFLDKEGPETKVRLTRGYWISRYEVSQGQFEAVLGFNPSLFKGDPQRPVEDVTWFECVHFCERLTEMQREAGRIPHSFEYRLPTEAEWAYACRAGTTTRFSYGDDPGYEQLRNYAWYSGNSGLRPHPIGQKLPNPWGLYDMHGNVFEWCSDWYAPLPGGDLTDPQGASSGTDHVIRGGYWDSGPELCRSAVRVHFIPNTRISYLGFRIVLGEITPPQAAQ